MYSHFELARKYLQYLITAANGKGHGVHSPFVFDFITHVLNDKKPFNIFGSIENRRKELLADKRVIEVEDFGAGSAMTPSSKRVIKAIAASSLKPKKYAQLLFRIVNYYKPATSLELGTSLGITSSYLAAANPQGELYTCEGSASIAGMAQETFDLLKFNNIRLVTGDFAATLPGVLEKAGPVDFAFIDGNHRKEPTIEYFDSLLQHARPSTIFVFDDIHWSKGMEEAWSVLRAHPGVSLTIDLFFIGLVFINPDFKVRQHFTIRF